MNPIVRGIPLLLSVGASWSAMACDEGRLLEDQPADFVNLAEIDPSIRVAGVYATETNFIGDEVTGYDEPACLLTRPAAEALSAAQQKLSGSGLTLLVFDCYRPQQAVNQFMEWATDGGGGDDDDDDGRAVSPLKQKYHPRLSREDLIDDVYIAGCSGHSRGSTVDLTITYRPGAEDLSEIEQLAGCDASFDGRPKGVDMGTGFDCFDERSHTESDDMPFHVQENRRMLKRLMEAEGFRNYEREWWHYTLNNEPYPDTRFDFEVE